MALALVKPILKERKTPPEILELVFPMIKDELGLKRAWAKNAAILAERAKNGKTVAFITVGDPMFYSTFVYLCQSIKEECPEVELEIIPGVTSLTACAASSKMPLAEKNEAVAIIPSAFDSKHIGEIAKYVDTLDEGFSTLKNAGSDFEGFWVRRKLNSRFSEKMHHARRKSHCWKARRCAKLGYPRRLFFHDHNKKETSK
jgi:precorrin-2/cobalt-factor-2 C20-methyltransferase